MNDVDIDEIRQSVISEVRQEEERAMHKKEIDEQTRLVIESVKHNENLTFIETSCSIRSAMNKENENQLEEMANQLCIDYLTH